MRILHLYSGNLFGGIEAILVTIARRSGGDARHEFALCFDGRLRTELAAAGAAVHALGAARISRPHSIRASRRALHTLLVTQRFDAAICHAPWSQAIFGTVVRRA